MTEIASPKRLFASISLVMIAVMLAASGFTEGSFFRQAILNREAALVHDVVSALVAEHGVSVEDLQNFMEPASKERLNRSFNALLGLHDIFRIKVFNRQNVIVWSDDANLVGTQRTAHRNQLEAAMSGQVRAVFNPAIASSSLIDNGTPRPQNIEFYVPLSLSKAGGSPQVVGALAVYRSPEQLSEVLLQGQYRLWAVVGGTGLLLFAALYQLFGAVYSKQKSAELQFSKLSANQQRLVQVEKMSAMGELVGKIAHQLNNPLIGVLNMAQLAEREADNPEKVRELLAEVRKGGTECREIIQRILRLNRSAKSEPQWTNLVEIVRDTIKFCEQGIELRQPIHLVTAADAAMLSADPVLIRHAVFNLIHNATLAAPDRMVNVEIAADTQGEVAGYRITVTDQGAGISEEAMRQLFTPFFTTRPNGTGLGLPVARHIVMKHGGNISAENVAQGGARFTVWLPTTTEP